MRLKHFWMAVGLLGACFNAAAAIAAAATIPDDPRRVNPVTVGSKAPEFTAREVDGRAFRFDTNSLHQPALLIFYRGGWCPYCNMHLHDLRRFVPQIVALGYQVVFLSTDQPQLLYSSLKEKVDYHIVSDSSMSAAHAFRIAFRVDDATVEKMKSFGVDLEAAQGNTRHELPVPAVFIVDRGGVIRFRHYDADYRVRLDPAAVLAAARAALPSSKPGRQYK